MRCYLIALFAIAISLLSAAGGATPVITIESLLHEMVDRDGLARFPEPAYVTRQASSYDRNSVAASDGKSWFANADRSQFVRTTERNGETECVLMDEAGPGAIVRFWATWHGPGGGPFSDGTLRFYFDGASEPAIEGPASQVLDCGLLAEGPLSEGVSPETPYAQRGHNLYLPIPYAKHCKVTYTTSVEIDRGARTGEALYYQINYRTYAAGTPVESFSMERLERAKSVVADTNRQLRECDDAATTGQATEEFRIAVGPHSASEPTVLSGPGAIRRLACRVVADDVEQALRSAVIEIRFDGEPAVWCPIGEFAGMGYKPRAFRTWYCSADNDGRIAVQWVMPFAREATIRVHNFGEQPVQLVDGAISHGEWKWDARSLHFHANWHQLTDVATGRDKAVNGDCAMDVNYVTCDGQGVYVGDALTVGNGAAAWWGEGDEKIFIDGESFPSHFGTGTEDYYGYAWCRPEFFTSAFHAQPDGSGNNSGGYSVNSRFRALDAIPFTKSLKFDMELWHWADTKVNYAPTVFWYGRPGAKSNVPADSKAAALPVARVRTDLVPVFRVPGAIEGEAMRVVKLTRGKWEVQGGGYGWSGDAQLWWTDAEVGDTLTLEFTAPQAGRRRLIAELTKANDYAVVEISVNGSSAVRVDRYHPTVAHEAVDLGEVDLVAGANTMQVKVVGEHPQAIKRRMFGLDFVKTE